MILLDSWECGGNPQVVVGDQDLRFQLHLHPKYVMRRVELAVGAGGLFA